MPEMATVIRMVVCETRNCGRLAKWILHVEWGPGEEPVHRPHCEYHAREWVQHLRKHDPKANVSLREIEDA